MPNQKWRREFVSISKPVQNHFWLRFLLTHDSDPCTSYQKCLNRPNKNFLAVNFQFLWRFCGNAVVGKDTVNPQSLYMWSIVNQLSIMSFFLFKKILSMWKWKIWCESEDEKLFFNVHRELLVSVTKFSCLLGRIFWVRWTDLSLFF